jgi:hypothetical protein
MTSAATLIIVKLRFILIRFGLYIEYFHKQAQWLRLKLIKYPVLKMPGKDWAAITVRGGVKRLWFCVFAHFFVKFSFLVNFGLLC